MDSHKKKSTKKKPKKFSKRFENVKNFLINKNIKIIEISNSKNIYTIDVLEYLYTKIP